MNKASKFGLIFQQPKVDNARVFAGFWAYFTQKPPVFANKTWQTRNVVVLWSYSQNGFLS